MARWACLGQAIAACLLLTGCGDAKQYKYRIAVIPKGLTHEFWQSIHRGAERAARDLDDDKGLPTEIIWDGPLKENDSLVQIRIVDRRISTRVNGIVLAPQHSKTMIAPVERANEQGIPVVIIDSGLDKDTLKQHPDLIVKYVATSNFHGGELAAEHLLKVLKQEGHDAPHLILFRYQIGSESTEQREKGFLHVVDKVRKEQAEAGRPTLTLLSDDKFAGATKDTAFKEASPLLNNMKAKGIDGIFAPNESSANGMLDALRGLELNKKVHLMGFDSSEPLLQAIREGDIDGLILQDPYKMGYLGVWTLVHHLEGRDIDPGIKKVSTGEYVITSANVLKDEPRRPFDEATRRLFDPKAQEKRKSAELRQRFPYVEAQDSE